MACNGHCPDPCCAPQLSGFPFTGERRRRSMGALGESEPDSSGDWGPPPSWWPSGQQWPPVVPGTPETPQTSCPPGTFQPAPGWPCVPTVQPGTPGQASSCPQGTVYSPAHDTCVPYLPPIDPPTPPGQLPPSDGYVSVTECEGRVASAQQREEAKTVKYAVIGAVASGVVGVVLGRIFR